MAAALEQVPQLMSPGHPAFLLTQPALEDGAESSAASLGIEDPRTDLEGRPMAYVTRVTAFELGYPVTMLILP